MIETRQGNAELSQSVLSPRRVMADPAGVDPAPGGRGSARMLRNRLPAAAPGEGFTIVPLCPCVDAQARRHPEPSQLLRV